MGVFARAVVKQALGWPNPGWAPPFGSVGKSITDITVNADTAMTVGAFHAGVRLIAEDIAAMPFHVFEKTDKEGARKAETHPTYKVLHESPNPEMTAMVWRETMLGHILSVGNCYSERVPNGLGQTVQLWPLRPDRMIVERDKDTARKVFKYRLPSGAQIILPNDRVFHVPGFGYDGLVGYSRIAMARRALENAIAIEEFGLHTFANGANPGVVIRHPQPLSKTAKNNIKSSWEEQHQGLTNSQRTAILDEGMEIETVGFNPEDAQFLESKRHSVEDVARWLRLAPHKLSDMSHATFSNIEESNLDHVIGTLLPNMVRFEQQVNKDLLATPFYAKHNAAHLLRGNTKDRAEFYVAMRQNGIFTDDEIRAFEETNALRPEDRTKLLVPLNSVPASAFDENGMTMIQRATAAGIMARAGYDPAGSLVAFNLPAIPHTGFLPVTVQAEPTIPPEKGADLGPELHVHFEKGAIDAGDTTVVLPESITIPDLPAPVVTVGSPIVHTTPPDMSRMEASLREVKTILQAPVEKELIRDPETKAIVGSRERRRAPDAE